MKMFLRLFVILNLAFFASGAFAVSSCDEVGNLDDYTDSQLEQLFQACENEIQAQKEALGEQQKETAGISHDVSILGTEIKKSQAVINARAIELRKIGKQITANKDTVKTLEEQADSTREHIAQLIKRKAELDSYSFIEAIFSEKTLSGFFEDATALNVLKVQLTAVLKKYEGVKEDAIASQEELEERKGREQELKAQKERERALVTSKQNEQKALLAISKKEEQTYKTIIAEKEKIKSQLRSRLFQVASGEKVSFGDAYDIIKIYESDLGVDAAFILAILFQESGWGGNIGGNIGQCFYNQSNSHGGSKNGYEVMSQSQQSNFETIMGDLGIAADKQVISCPIPKDGAYGGAMGPAQFMPNTWMDIRSQASNYIGVSAGSLSPFVNRDAFVASGTYLRNLYYSSGCSDYANKYSYIRSKRSLREKCAAAKYYAGGGWYKFRNSYGESVTSRADRFRNDIATLND